MLSKNPSSASTVWGKIEAILAIFEHFKVWTFAQDLRAKSHKTFRARPRLVNMPLLVVGMNFIPRPLAIGMRFIPMDGGCLPHWDEALDESTGIIEAVYFAV